MVATTDGGTLAGEHLVSSFSMVTDISNLLQIEDAKPDLSTHLISNTSQDAPGLALLYGESRLIISAGSETTSTALTFVFMHLAIYPEYMHAVRKEFRDNRADYSCERPRPILDAVIQESMRLCPSIFFGSQRISPPQGMSIDGRYIPGNIIVQVAPYPINRDERNFVRPTEFIPERWTTKPEMVLNKGAFKPFSTGPYNCAGKDLAYMELRSVVARVINEFDVLLPAEFVTEKYFEGIKDHFTAGPPLQMVSFIRTGD